MRVYRVLRGWVLPCGCNVGVYETYGGDTVAIVDRRAGSCPDTSHRAGSLVDMPSFVPAAGGQRLQSAHHSPPSGTANAA